MHVKTLALILLSLFLISCAASHDYQDAGQDTSATEQQQESSLELDEKNNKKKKNQNDDMEKLN